MDNSSTQNPNVLFGKRLALRRIAKGFSQEAFAKQCGLNRTYIGTIERGEKSATVNTLYKLAAGLNVEVKDLFEEVII